MSRIEVRNAVDAAGRPLAFTVEDGRFRDVRTGPAAAPKQPEHAAGTVGLDALADAARLPAGTIVDAAGATLLPGGVDAHVHSRDPGLEHKETWATLARGAWRGGVVAVADMPNTIPPTMTRAAVLEKAERAAASGLAFRLLAGVGASNIRDVAALLTDPSLPVCALKVFYGKTTGELMYDDLETLGRSLPADGSKLIVFHSEDQCTVDCNQKQHAGELASRDNAAFAVHSKVRSSAAAHASTRTILAWAKGYGRPIHIAHVSTPVEIELIAEARAAGVRVTSEVAPHHLLLSVDDYPRLGPLAKMNPPLRSRAEVDQLLRLVGQGAVDIFATDHAPHTLAEKQVEVGRSPSGVPAVELFYPLVLEIARLTGLAAETAVAMASARPAALFGFEGLGRIADGFEANFAALTREALVVRGEEVVSKCGWTPYDGRRLPHGVQGTWYRGRRVHWSGTPR
jgi:dihydroorotase